MARKSTTQRATQIAAGGFLKSAMKRSALMKFALNKELASILGVSAPATTPKKGKMSAAGRAKVAAAQKARWAKIKATKPAATAPTKKRKMSAAAKAKLSALAKARWARVKKAGKKLL